MMKNGKQVILMLDIDGVLHPACREIQGPPVEAEQMRVDIVRGRIDPASLGLLDIDKQHLLASVLAQHPQCRIVVSSAWKTWEGYNFWIDEAMDEAFEATRVRTLAWLKDWLLPGIAERIIGATPLGDNRLTEIEEAIQTLAPGAHWVAIDDQARHFPADVIPSFYFEQKGGHYDTSVPANRVVVLLDGKRGLSPASAAALDAALRHAATPPEMRQAA